MATAAADFAIENTPNNFLCWSRMQAEAGHALERIIARKEVERATGEGLFFWGVGNAPSLAISSLAKLNAKVPVIFSIMKSRPKQVDSSPSRVVAWRKFIDAWGVEQLLPPSAIITSRGDSAKGPKKHHYALMCYSESRLTLQRGRSFDVSAYRNAGGRGAPVGASQVTALLKQVSSPAEEADYEINLQAELVGGYWVRLTDPVEVPHQLNSELSKSDELSKAEWLGLSNDIRNANPSTAFAKEPTLV